MHGVTSCHGSNQQSSGPNMWFSYCTSPGLVSMHLLIYNLQETCQSKRVGSKAKAHYVHLQANISHQSLFSMYSANIYVIGNHIFFSSTRCFSSMLMSYTRLCKWKTYDGQGELFSCLQTNLRAARREKISH